MIGSIIAFALANWRWLGGATAGVLVVGLVWGHVHHDSRIKAQLAAAQAGERKAHANASQWAAAYGVEKAAVEAQNAQVARLATDAAHWQQRAQAATAEAHRANVAAQASAADFLKLKLRGATVCERAEDASAKINRDLR